MDKDISDYVCSGGRHRFDNEHNGGIVFDLFEDDVIGAASVWTLT